MTPHIPPTLSLDQLTEEERSVLGTLYERTKESEKPRWRRQRGVSVFCFSELSSNQQAEKHLFQLGLAARTPGYDGVEYGYAISYLGYEWYEHAVTE